MLKFNNFTITKREIIVSICILSIMMVIGLFISDKITDSQIDSNEKYNKAIKIESKDIFEYGMRTNVGDAFVYGDLVSVDTVTYPEIGGKYIYIEKVKQRYTMHTRTVCSKVGKSNVCRTETYWTWDTVDRDSLKAKEIKFLGVTFDSNKTDLPDSKYLKTIKESSRIRYKYYVVGTKFKGTIFTKLKDNTISKSSDFYNNYTIEETYNSLISNSKLGLWIFWIVWIVLTSGLIYLFYYIENDWLED